MVVVVVVVILCFVDPVYMLMLHLWSLRCVFCIASLPLDTMGSSVLGTLSFPGKLNFSKTLLSNLTALLTIYLYISHFFIIGASPFLQIRI